MKRRLMVAGVVLLAFTVQASALSDARKGKRVFRNCKECHSVGVRADIKDGPPLNGVVGRKVASYKDFKYSKGMKEFGKAQGEWDVKSLNTYVLSPRGMIPKTYMKFKGLDSREDIKYLVIYLNQFNLDGTTK